MMWQPIETYPMSGQSVILFFPELVLPGVIHIEQMMVSYMYSHCDWVGVSKTSLVRPTHWMPLPAKPEIKQ